MSVSKNATTANSWIKRWIRTKTLNALGVNYRLEDFFDDEVCALEFIEVEWNRIQANKPRN